MSERKNVINGLSNARRCCRRGWKFLIPRLASMHPNCSKANIVSAYDVGACGIANHPTVESDATTASRFFKDSRIRLPNIEFRGNAHGVNFTRQFRRV